MIKSKSLLCSCLLPFVAFFGAPARAQTAPACADPGLSAIVSQIAPPLEKKHNKKVIVADLTGPNGERHPAGKWLADRLSECLTASYPAIEAMNRPADSAAPNGEQGESGIEAAQSAAKNWAHRLGAKVVITGSFAEAIGGIAISLVAEKTSGDDTFLVESRGRISDSREISELSSEPLPRMATGVLRAGVAGMAVPTCVYCPPPQYTSEARAARIEGSVMLQITVTLDGRATDISITRSLDPALDASAVNTIKKWKFTPAIGRAGKPVPVIVPIEMTFRLYHN